MRRLRSGPYARAGRKRQARDPRYGGRDPHVNFWLRELAKRPSVTIIEVTARRGIGLFPFIGPPGSPPTYDNIAVDVLGYSKGSEVVEAA